MKLSSSGFSLSRSSLYGRNVNLKAKVDSSGTRVNFKSEAPKAGAINMVSTRVKLRCPARKGASCSAVTTPLFF